MGIDVDKTMGKGKLIDDLLLNAKEIIFNPLLSRIIKRDALCKQHRDNPELTERFELMVLWKRSSQCLPELNDPIDQRERFEEQMRLSEKEMMKQTELLMKT
jgi:lysyl-tRNA synthetase class 2